MRTGSMKAFRWSRKGISSSLNAYPIVSSPSHIKCLRFYSSTAGHTSIDGKPHKTDSWTNVPATIRDSVNKRLHLEKNHPLAITRKLIESRFPGYKHHNDLYPIVSTHQNFDVLGFPPDHPGRNKTDTYYVNKDTVLRTHTSAHQVDTFRANLSDGFTVSGDVYRRDAVDRSHYPIFHQMEGAMTWDRKSLAPGETLAQRVWADVGKIPKHNLIVEDSNPFFHSERNRLQAPHDPEEVEALTVHLKRSVENVVVEIFAQASAAAAAATNVTTIATTEPLRVRWLEDSFPFTSPSWQLEVSWQGDWLELLGSGIISQSLLDLASVPNRSGWAVGFGLERIAMLLFDIPDIRLFWSRDQRFLSQFDEGKPVARFVPFSKYPAAPRDVAFWLPKKDAVKGVAVKGVAEAASAAGGSAKDASIEGGDQGVIQFHENDIMEIVRDVAGDSVETVSLVDEFTHPKTGRKSLCYRVVYRSLEKTMTSEEANAMHERVRQELMSKFHVELR